MLLFLSIKHTFDNPPFSKSGSSFIICREKLSLQNVPKFDTNIGTGNLHFLFGQHAIELI